MLCNGTGGIDWSGLPYAVSYLGVRDVQALIDGLLLVKAYKPPEGGQGIQE